MPGLFRDWGTLDNARNTMRPELDAAFDQGGLQVIGWGDVGMAHLMTKGFEVHSPGRPEAQELLLPRGRPDRVDVLPGRRRREPEAAHGPRDPPGLTAGTINVVNAPALAAEQLQWASLLDHINTSPSGIGIGALVFTASKINCLPADAADRSS